VNGGDDSAAARAGGGAIRLPAHAGTFYPAAPDALRRLVDAQLAEAVAAQPGRPWVGFVVPHAGLVYSGSIAAAAWATLAARPPATIVLAGTNHYVAGLRGVAIWPAGAWRTPLGDVRVDAAVASRILALGAPFEASPATHRREHSIEVQLPFIVRSCPTAAIVPLLVSFDDPRAGLAAGAQLGRLLGGLRDTGHDVVLVASSDFAHYPSARDAEAATEALLPPLLALDGEELARREADLREAGIPGLVCGMCGIEPVVFALGAFRAMGLRAGTLLAAGTSADVPRGDPERTVGYAAIGFA
jgi:AmmeMemoRadiSam system protein B